MVKETQLNKNQLYFLNASENNCCENDGVDEKHTVDLVEILVDDNSEVCEKSISFGGLCHRQSSNCMEF